MQGAPGLVSASQPDVCGRSDCCLCWCGGFNALSGRTNNIWTPQRSLKQAAKGFFHALVQHISAVSFDCAHSIWPWNSAFDLWELRGYQTVCLCVFFYLHSVAKWKLGHSMWSSDVEEKDTRCPKQDDLEIWAWAKIKRETRDETSSPESKQNNFWDYFQLWIYPQFMLYWLYRASGQCSWRPN